jgi:vacuole morphology and inheritance protein 14
MADEVLTAAVLRNVGDKLYDRRKAAALDVEQGVKRLVAAGDQGAIRTIVDKVLRACQGVEGRGAPF